MTKQQKENIAKVNQMRDALLCGYLISKTQEVGGRGFVIVIRMEGTSDNRIPSEQEKLAAETMAEYVVYGGMAV